MAPPGDVLATIAVSMEPKWIAVAPDGSRAYAAPRFANPSDVVVIDTTSNTVIATVTAAHVTGLVVAPDGRHVYVANWGDPSHPGSLVSVIDTSTNAIVDRIVAQPPGPGVNTAGLAITPDGRELYVAMETTSASAGAVAVIDTATKAIVASVKINPFPHGAGARPDGSAVYVLDNDGGPAVIDTATHQASFPFDQAGDVIAFTPDGTLAYFARDSETFVDVRDLTGGAGSTTLDVGNSLITDVAVTPDGGFVYVTHRTSGQISVFEVGITGVPAHPVAWSGTADGIAFTPDGRTAYVADTRSRALRVIPAGPPTD